MTTTTTYPNGQQLISSAITTPAINVLMQVLTCGMIGVNPPNNSRVRVDWQTTGQPAVPAPGQDVCYIACQPFDTEYSRVRDMELSGGGPVVETWTYTRGWRVAWCAYGPSAVDNLRAVKSALFIDYFTNQLSLSNLFPLPDPPEITRVPELINAQWFERADFHVDMYEAVTETIEDAAVSSLEIKVYDGNDPSVTNPVADIVVSA